MLIYDFTQLTTKAAATRRVVNYSSYIHTHFTMRQIHYTCQS
jgi:hypothetical protein